MENEILEEIYSRVFRHVYPQVKDLRQGILYKTIKIILGEETIQTREKTPRICNYIGITATSSIEDDYRIVNELVNSVFINRVEKIHEVGPQIFSDFIEFTKPFIQQIRNFISRFFLKVFLKQDDINEEEKMKWIVIAACALVGLYFCIQYLNRNKQRGEEHLQSQSILLLEPADLCLVVLASIASAFKDHSELTMDELKYLIGKSSYFLCTTVDDADLIEENLDITDEYISSDSNREVFIRVNLDKGSNLVGERTPYALKEKLQPNTTCVITQMACLDSLSGLESLNLV
jgi:hypothetical protein